MEESCDVQAFTGFHFCFQVAGLFRDPSIGNAINIVVVRLILLEQDEVKSCLFMSRFCV